MGNLEALPELIGIKVRCHSQCIPGPEGPESQPELPEARVSPEALGRPLERAFGHSLRRLSGNKLILGVEDSQAHVSGQIFGSGGLAGSCVWTE
jgi:hypothetical protein